MEDGRERLCGKHVRQQDDAVRTFCGVCTKIPIPYLEGLVLKPGATLYESEGQRNDQFPKFIPEYGVRQAARPAPTTSVEIQTTAVPTVSVEIQTTISIKKDEEFAKIEYLEAIIDEIWNGNKTTLRNSKTCIRRALSYIGLTLEDTKREFVRRCGDLEELMNKVLQGKDNSNTSSKVKVLLSHIKANELHAKWEAFHTEKFMNQGKRYNDVITPAKREKIETIATTVEVDLGGRYPGERLLEALRHRIIEFQSEMETAADRRWFFNQLLLWFLPAARGQAAHFKWHSRCPETHAEFKETDQHLVILDREKHVAGLFFGKLKMAKKYTTSWRKRFFITERGMQTLDDGCQIPSHLTEGEWSHFVKLLFGVLNEQRSQTEARTNAFIFPGLSTSERDNQNNLIGQYSEKFYGTRLGAQLGRTIFRNGVLKSSPFFLRYVMQHCQWVDERSYKKKCLLEGPWSTDAVSE